MSFRRRQTILIVVPAVVLAAASLMPGALPRRWAWVPTVVLVVAMTVVIVVVDRKTRVLDQRRRAGHCECGFDLRAAPPREVSEYSFGVDERIVSTKQRIVCPECGREHTVWESG